MTRRMDELNALEEAEAELKAGCSILAIERDEPVAKLLAALAWVHKRRTDQKLTFGDYVKSARTKDNVNYLFGSDEDDAEDEDERDAAVVESGPHPDAEDRALDDEGVPTDPFPAAAAPLGDSESPDGVADTEGQILSLERGSA